VGADAVRQKPAAMVNQDAADDERVHRMGWTLVAGEGRQPFSAVRHHRRHSSTKTIQSTYTSSETPWMIIEVDF
jgi:hypothetical protein